MNRCSCEECDDCVRRALREHDELVQSLPDHLSADDYCELAAIALVTGRTSLEALLRYRELWRSASSEGREFLARRNQRDEQRRG